MAERFTIRSKGNSMFPLLMDGDIVEFGRISSKDIESNDIVLIFQNGVFITHRVLYIKKHSVITKGDNNKKADKEIPLDNVFAKAFRFKRRGAWFGISDIYSSQSLVYSKEILTVSTLLQQSKIPHVFIKGLVASLKYVQRFPQRIYSDIDLLIEREDFLKVKEVFNSAGYSEYTDLWLSFKKQASLPKFEVDFVKTIRKVPIVFDIHLEPVFLMIKMDGMGLLYKKIKRKELGSHFIKNKKWLSLLGGKVPVCSPIDQVIYLSLHIFHNNFTDIVRLRFVNEIIHSNITPRMWADMNTVIKKYSLQGYIYPVFSLLRKYFNTKIPSQMTAEKGLNGYKKYAALFVIKNGNVFNGSTRIMGGIIRLLFIVIFSPEPFYKKIVLSIHPDTIKSLFWVFIKKIYSTVKKQPIQRD